jgi:hypothetical protein
LRAPLHRGKEPEGITWGKVGSAAAGTLAVNIATNLFTKTRINQQQKKTLKKLSSYLSSIIT